MKRGVVMSARDARQQGKEKPKTSTVILIIIGILILISLVVIAIMLIKGKNANEEVVVESKNRNVIVTPENVDEITSQLDEQEYVPAGYYSTEMCMEWHFASGDVVSDDAYVKNDITNSNDVYFDVFLEDDESTPILQSPIIPRGSEMTQIALDTPLGVGEYNCVMVYHLVDNEQNSIATLRVGFTIIVEN